MHNLDGKKLLALVIALAVFGGLAALVYAIRENVNFPFVDRDGNSFDRTPANSTGLPFKLEDGFKVATFAEGLNKPRVMVFSPDGMLVASDMGSGEIIGLPDDDDSGEADTKLILARNLSNPHGLVFVSPTELLIAEEHRVSSWRYAAESRTLTFTKVLTGLPEGGNHVTRSLALGKDGKIYISIGSSCNVCTEEDKQRAAVLRMNADGTSLETWATGLRNSVFLTPHPERDELWATEMGRDLLGDNLPPDELNIIPDGGTAPGNYGWPHCYGKNVHDTEFDKNVVYKQSPCGDSLVRSSHFDFPAHIAPLGLEFIPGDTSWPDDWAGDLIVAFHGSWNSSQKVGYKLVRLEVDDQQNVSAMHDFMTGLLSDSGDVLGRPAGLLMDGDGTLYVADDGAGRIFRITP